MKLFSHARSPWCRKVDWALAEMNLTAQIPTEVISAANPAQQEGIAIMKAACGKHATVPALVDDNFILVESSAIVFYLAERFQYNGSFLPNSPQARAEAHMWDRICDINLGANILSPWLRNTIFLGNNVADQNVFAKCKENFAKLEERLNDTLTNKKYLMGENFTYADVGMAHLLASLVRADGPQVSMPPVKTWLENCLNREAYKVLAERQ
jgi:glutathione S-transferase